jgi:hypothetical protein
MQPWMTPSALGTAACPTPAAASTATSASPKMLILFVNLRLTVLPSLVVVVALLQ